MALHTCYAQLFSYKKANVVNFSQSDYKAANQNWSIAVAPDGMVYFGNNNGLLAYDGIKWELSRIPEINLVRSVAMDNDSIIFVGGFEEFGFVVLSKGNLIRYESLSTDIPHDIIHNQEIWRIFLNKGKVYFQSFGIIFVWDGKNAISKILPPNNSSFVLLNKVADRLFIHEIGYGLHEISGDSLVFLEGSEIFAKDEVKNMVSFPGNKILIGTANHGFYIYDGHDFKPWNVNINTIVKGAEINHCIAIDSTHFMVGTIVEGIYVINANGDILQQISTNEFLQNNTVLGLQSDAQGNVWAALDRGIDYIRINDPLNFYLSPNTSSRSVYDAVIFNNKLWLATNQGVFLYENAGNQGVANYKLIPGSQGHVWMLKVIEGKLYCGHNNGTFLITENGAELISAVHGGFMIRPLKENENRYFIQSTYNSLVLYENQHGKLNMLHEIPGFREPVPLFEIDYLGNIWAAHMKHGLYKIRLNKDASMVEKAMYFDNSHGLANDKEISIVKVEGRIVICSGEKLYTYDDLTDSLVVFTKLNDALGDFSKSNKIISDGAGKYWCIHGNKIALFAMNQNHFEKMFSYDLERQGVFLTYSFPNISILSDSLHLVCLDNGFALYKPGIVPPNSKSHLSIRKIRAFDTDRTNMVWVNPLFTVTLQHKFSTLEFSFSPVQQMVNPLFRYRLRGSKENWSEWINAASATFERLPPGEFTFEVQMVGIDGTESDIESYSFRILPPWYNSVAARMLYFLFSLVLFLAMRIYFKKRIQQQANQIHLSEIERHIHEKMEAEQELILLRNLKLQDELTRQNIDLANFTLNASKTNVLLSELKEEIVKQKSELGNRYPKYYSERLLKLIEANETNEDAWNMFEMHFDKVNNHFFKRLKESYPDLTPSDMKLCAFLRLNLNTKEIAPLLNITIRGVEIRRYRLRKRLALHTEDNLIDFIMKF